MVKTTSSFFLTKSVLLYYSGHFRTYPSCNFKSSQDKKHQMQELEGLETQIREARQLLKSHGVRPPPPLDMSDEVMAPAASLATAFQTQPLLFFLHCVDLLKCDISGENTKGQIYRAYDSYDFS